jgi:tRNA(Ile)-lysidine synthase
MSSTEERHPLERRVARFLRAAGMGRGSALVAGISGGSDSTALLLILSAIAEAGGFAVHACTVDHGIRPRTEVEGDIAFVKNLCGSRGIPFHLLRIPTGECATKAERERKSPEEAARELRLSLLSGLAGELGSSYVVLGHTRDDQVETLIMRVLQGAGIPGLSGIRPKRGIFLRPLLSTSRSELLSYLSEKGAGYRSDSTNSETVYLRNRIRASVIPVLQDALPGFQAGLLEMARKFSLFGGFLSAEAASRLRWEDSGEGRRIRERDFFDAPPALRVISLMSLYDRIGLSGHPRRIPFRFLQPVLGERPPKGPVLIRGHGFLLRRDRGDLLLGRDIATYGEKGYFIIVEKARSYAISEASAHIEILSGNAASGVEGIKVGIYKPAVLRSRRKGDAFLAECGNKTIKSLFSEWKVRAEDRSRIPILADRRGIVAVLGGALGYGTRVRVRKGAHAEETVVVRIRRTKEMDT